MILPAARLGVCRRQLSGLSHWPTDRAHDAPVVHSVGLVSQAFLALARGKFHQFDSAEIAHSATYPAGAVKQHVGFCGERITQHGRVTVNDGTASLEISESDLKAIG